MGGRYLRMSQMQMLKTPLNLKIAGLIVIILYHVVKFDADAQGLWWVFVPFAVFSCSLFFFSFVIGRERDIRTSLAFFAISLGFSAYMIVGAASGTSGAKRILSSEALNVISSISVVAFLLGLIYILYLKVNDRLPSRR
jgi:hypothetical protein